MILDEKKIQCIDYIIEGYTITQISKLCNCSRQAIYDWLKDNDFKSELDKRTQEMSVAGNKKIVADVDKYINKLKLLALEGKSEKTQIEALTYLLNRIYGTPTSKVADVTENKDKNENNINLDEELKEFKNIELNKKAK